MEPVIVEKFKTGSAIIDGVEIKYNKRTGLVFWMSDWARCFKLGLRVKNYQHLYGHTDLFFDKGKDN